jgi:transposase
MKNTIKQAVSADQNIISELQDKIALLENEKAELLAKLFWFEEKFRLEQHIRYGRSSEQTIPEQHIIKEIDSESKAFYREEFNEYCCN